MVVDADRVYGKLTDLAEAVGGIQAEQKNIVERLDISNGNLAELKKDFDQKLVDDALEKGIVVGKVDAQTTIMKFTAALIGVIGTIVTTVISLLYFIG